MRFSAAMFLVCSTKKSKSKHVHKLKHICCLKAVDSWDMKQKRGVTTEIGRSSRIFLKLTNLKNKLPVIIFNFRNTVGCNLGIDFTTVAFLKTFCRFNAVICNMVEMELILFYPWELD